MDTAEKVRENRVRRTITRMGYRLEKSRVRDPVALGYGRYWVRSRTSGFEAPAFESVAGHGLYLREVEERISLIRQGILRDPRKRV